MAEHEHHDDDEKKATEAADEKLIAEAHERFKQCVDTENEQRLEAVEDLKFLNGDQWPQEIRDQRKGNDRPCHTINRLPQFVRQTTNPQRSNRVSAHVLPVDDKADIPTAEVLQGIIRHIEVQSHAPIAYDTAAFYAAAMGWGYWHITTEYSSPMSFDQDLRIVRVRNPFSIYLDPSLQEPDGSDAEFGFVTEQFATKEQFKEVYPEADVAGLEDWQAHGDPESDWVGKDGGIRVVQYYYRDYKRDKLLLVETAQGPLPILESQAKLLNLDKARIIESRETKIPTIKWCKLNAIEVLERDDWPGPWIPIVKVIGDEIEIEGKLQLSGIIRFAKDPQRQLNYMASAETEAIALTPKAPVVGYEGQFEGHKKEWAEANVKNFAYLEVKPITLGGQIAPLPQRLQASPDIGAIVQARREAENDLSGVIGMYPPQLGAPSNETSGRAIMARTQQGETTNFHYSDNVRRSIEHSCRILVYAVPRIYDTPRMVRIIGEDDEQKIVQVNKQFQDNGDNGKSKHYKLDVGKYDVICAAGPSYGSKRQAAAASMIELTRNFPALMEIGGDLLVESLDIPKAQELAKRLRERLELQDGKQPIPPQAKAEMEQMSQMLEALTKALDKSTEENKKLEGRQGIERDKLDAQMAQLQLRLDSSEAIALLKTEIDALKARLQVNVAEKAKEAAQTAKEIP
jgi:hypothetical protein